MDRGRGQGARQSAGGPAGRLGRRVYRERAVGDRLRLTIEPFKRRGLVCRGGWFARGGLNVLSAEKGLLGSNYWGKHLPIPARDISLDLNFDAVPPIGIPASVNVTGAERTSFYPTVEKTSAAFGYEIEADAEPGAGHYYRSDHFSLARAGVPAFSINTALKFEGHPAEWGRAQREEYTAKHYHQPSDEYSSEMDFSSNAALAQFGYALGWEALDAPSSITWQPGDEFEAARKSSASP